MKIGVIGLKPRQIADMGQRNFGELELSYFDGKSLAASTIGSFCRGLDLVIMMQQALPRHAFDAVPADRRYLLNGSVSTLVRELETRAGINNDSVESEPDLGRQTKKSKRPNQQPTPKTVVKSVREKPAPRPARNTLGNLLHGLLGGVQTHLASDVPGKRRSEYSKPEGDVHVYPVEKLKGLEGQMRKYLMMAAVGEVVRFAKPDDSDFAAWRQEVQLTAATLQHRYDLPVEVHFYTSYLDAQVMTPFETKLPDQKPLEPVKFSLNEVREAYNPVTVAQTQPALKIVKPVFIAPPVIAEAAPVVEVKVEVPEPVVATPVGEVVKVESPKPLLSDIPYGYPSQYWTPDSEVLINYPNSGGVQSYQILEATVPGDVLRFARPIGLPLAKWRARVNSTRHYWWAHKDVLLEAHFYEEYVDLKVMEPNENKVPVNTLNRTYQRTQPVNEPRDMGATTKVDGVEDGLKLTGMFGDNHVICEVYKEEATPVSTTQPEFDFEEPSSEEAAEEEATPTPEVTQEAEVAVEQPVKVEHSAAEKQFWRLVYVSSFDGGSDVEGAALDADEALKLYRDRFA